VSDTPNESTRPNESTKAHQTEVRVWDLPLRLWHWSMIAALAVSLYTGLTGDIMLFDLHKQAGYTVLGLLAFRLLWGLWGGLHARWWRYGTTPVALWRYFRNLRKPESHILTQNPHTPPGALMAIGLWCVVALQAGTGLYSSDMIISRGPLVRGASDELVRNMTWIHVRAFWLIFILAGIHILAIASYHLFLKEPLAKAMITGRKPFVGPETPNFVIRAVLTLAAAIYLVRWIVT
jgi:cytochrome b